MYRFILVFVLLVTGVQKVICQTSKIDSKLLGAPKNEIQNIVVILHEQADISHVKSLRGKDVKANYVYTQLTEKANNTQKEVKDLLQSKSKSYRSFYIVNMVSLSADMALMEEIAALSSVKSIIRDGNFMMLNPVEDRSVGQSRTIEWNISKIKAPEVWALGYTGQNVVVGGQDTGYKWDHVALKNQYRGWNGSVADHNYNWHDAIHEDNPISGGSNPCGFNSSTPCDDNNHGTHTMGTMVGDDGGSNQIGVAPGAKWIGCRNMENGYGTLTTYVECFEWFLAPTPVGGGTADPTKMPDVINNSWGCLPMEGCNTSNFSVMEAALNNLRGAGCVIVVSAGNSGPACNTVQDPAAIFGGSFSVGSTMSTDVISVSSSRGPVTVDGSNRLKPNVSAPGSNVRSSIRNGGYGSSSGTSMAGPHVAGLVALLISANPALSGEVDLIEDIIEQTAVHLTSGQTCNNVPGSNIPNNTFGYGRIDALAAVEMALITKYEPFVKSNSAYLINDLNAGLVLTNVENEKYRIKVNNLGELTVSQITNVLPASIGTTSGSIAAEQMLSFILRSPNNALWRLSINGNGKLVALSIPSIPSNTTIIQTSDFYIQEGLKGLISRDVSNNCYLTNITTLGQIITIPTTCPN
jgi:serine protease AprX